MMSVWPGRAAATTPAQARPRADRSGPRCSASSSPGQISRTSASLVSAPVRSWTRSFGSAAGGPPIAAIRVGREPAGASATSMVTTVSGASVWTRGSASTGVLTLGAGPWLVPSTSWTVTGPSFARTGLTGQSIMPPTSRPQCRDVARPQRHQGTVRKYQSQLANNLAAQSLLLACNERRLGVRRRCRSWWRLGAPDVGPARDSRSTDMAASADMCGIAGIATSDGLQSQDTVLLDNMLRALAHRGPDEQRQVRDANAAIGARRLAIIDLETGSQPVSGEDEAIQVVQNGEIYNYVELREDLLRRGHTLHSRGDTEVIAHLYEDHGDDFVHHLRGMFAIAIWDGRRRRLVLARDRFGKKPLYWRRSGERLLFASELKAILLDPATPRRLDRTALADYLQYQYVPAPRSIFADIQKLPPASLLTWDGGEVQIARYWHLAYRPKADVSPDERREATLELLREAVTLRLRSDVPVGLFLSGGMDSSTVLALAAGSADLRTFTIAFEESGYHESASAAAVARHFGTRHTEETVRLDVLSVLPRLAAHFDEPLGDSSAIPTFRLSA